MCKLKLDKVLLCPPFSEILENYLLLLLLLMMMMMMMMVMMMMMMMMIICVCLCGMGDPRKWVKGSFIYYVPKVFQKTNIS